MTRVTTTILVILSFCLIFYAIPYFLFSRKPVSPAIPVVETKPQDSRQQFTDEEIRAQIEWERNHMQKD